MDLDGPACIDLTNNGSVIAVYDVVFDEKVEGRFLEIVEVTTPMLFLKDQRDLYWSGQSARSV